MPAWRPKSGHWYFGDGDQRSLFAWFPSIPQGHVKARYVIDSTTHETTGTGYHDHNWGDAPMAALMHDWYWARGKVGAYTVVASYITAEARYGYQPLPILLIAKDGVIVVDQDERKIRFGCVVTSSIGYQAPILHHLQNTTPLARALVARSHVV